MGNYLSLCLIITSTVEQDRPGEVYTVVLMGLDMREVLFESDLGAIDQNVLESIRVMEFGGDVVSGEILYSIECTKTVPIDVDRACKISLHLVVTEEQEVY